MSGVARADMRSASRWSLHHRTRRKEAGCLRRACERLDTAIGVQSRKTGRIGCIASGFIPYRNLRSSICIPPLSIDSIRTGTDIALRSCRDQTQLGRLDRIGVLGHFPVRAKGSVAGCRSGRDHWLAVSPPDPSGLFDEGRVARQDERSCERQQIIAGADGGEGVSWTREIGEDEITIVVRLIRVRSHEEW